MKLSHIKQQLSQRFEFFVKPNLIDENTKLNSGSFGEVKKWNYKMSLQLAIKSFKNFETHLDLILNEINILHKYRHPYLVTLYGLYEDKKDKKQSISLITELIKGDTLNDFTNDNSELDELMFILILLDLCTVLTYVHSLKLIHRDIKLANVMVDQEFNVRLLDFGLSKIFLEEFSGESIFTGGTEGYMAPETYDMVKIVDNKPILYSKNLTTKADVYSFGHMIHIINTKMPNLMERNSGFWTEFIAKCKLVDPSQRISIKEAKDMLLEHLSGIVKEITFNSETKFFERIDKPDKKFHLLRKLEGYLKDIAHKEKNQFNNENNFTLGVDIFTCEINPDKFMKILILPSKKERVIGAILLQFNKLHKIITLVNKIIENDRNDTLDINQLKHYQSVLLEEKSNLDKIESQSVDMIDSYRLSLLEDINQTMNRIEDIISGVKKTKNFYSQFVLSVKNSK